MNLVKTSDKYNHADFRFTLPKVLAENLKRKRTSVPDRLTSLHNESSVQNLIKVSQVAKQIIRQKMAKIANDSKRRQFNLNSTMEKSGMFVPLNKISELTSRDGTDDFPTRVINSANQLDMAEQADRENNFTLENNDDL